MTGVQTCALRSEEHTSELQSHDNLVCRLLLEKNDRNDPRKIEIVGITAEEGEPAVRAHAQSRRALRPRPRSGGRTRHPLRGLLFFFLRIGRPPGFTLFPAPPLFG